MQSQKVEPGKLWSEEFDKDLDDVRQTIKVHVWAHDKKAAELRQWGIVYNVLIITLGAMLTAGSAVLKTYLPDWVVLYAETMGVAVALASGMRMYFNPEDMRAKHISATKDKNGLSADVKLQLLIPREHRRWQADDFYQYINERFAVIETTAPYLSESLLAKYPKPEKVVDGTANVAALMRSLKNTHLKNE